MMKEIAQKKNTEILSLSYHSFFATPSESERGEDLKNFKFGVTKRKIFVHGLFSAMIHPLNVCASILCYDITRCLDSHQ